MEILGHNKLLNQLVGTGARVPTGYFGPLPQALATATATPYDFKPGLKASTQKTENKLYRADRQPRTGPTKLGYLRVLVTNIFETSTLVTKGKPHVST